MKKHIRNVLSALLSFAILCSFGQTVFAANFTDVGPSAWYAQAVEFVSESGLMSGTGSGKFSPDTPMTRAMLAAVLHRMDGAPAPTSSHGFSDVPQGAYYEQAVSWAAENGIVSGIGGGRFGSESHITRQDLTVMLYRYSSFKGYDISAADSLAGFSDSNRVAEYARQAMQWAVGAGILHGDSGRLMPAGNATRAQVAVMLMNFAQNVVGTGPAPDPESNWFQITVNGQTFDGEFYDNETAKAFAAMLPATLDMQELNGNEKYYFFDSSLPTNASRPSGIHTGDLMLYGNNCLVLFYEDFATSYSYTPIGRLDDPAGLERALGAGDVQVTFSSER